MSEFILDEDDASVQYVRPDETGFTLRTRFKGTQDILDRNARLRSEAPKSFRESGHTFHHVASVPMEVVELLHKKLGRWPTAEELLKLSDDRDYNKLKTREVKL